MANTKQSNEPIYHRRTRGFINEQKQKAIELYNSGLSNKEIAATLGVNENFVYRYANQKKKQRTPEEVKELQQKCFDLKKQGLNSRQIGEQLGISEPWAFRLLNPKPKITDIKNISLSLQEVTEVLRKYPKHPLWKKNYKKFTNKDFNIIINMQKLLLLLLITFTVSCSNDCDELKEQAKQQYLKSLKYAGSNSSAILEVTRQYNEKINKINNDCK